VVKGKEADWEGVVNAAKEDEVVVDPDMRSLEGATSKEACMHFVFCKEGWLVDLLVLHGLDVSAQGFVGLAYWSCLIVALMPSGL
jgi:hypothetical protein